MELTVFFLLVFTGFMYWWAEKWGRQGWQFALGSLLCMPLGAAIILLIMGKDQAVLDAEEAVKWTRCRACGKGFRRAPYCAHCGAAH